MGRSSASQEKRHTYGKPPRRITVEDYYRAVITDGMSRAGYEARGYSFGPGSNIYALNLHAVRNLSARNVGMGHEDPADLAPSPAT